MEKQLTTIGKETGMAAEELLQIARLKPGQILVVGCSTSEVQGASIGSRGSEVAAAKILTALKQVCCKYQVHLAVQCCEHLNRALVVERPIITAYGLEEVSVVPRPKAGGALAAQAMQVFSSPAVVEMIAAHAGMDIGGTLIGMHLKRVAVPVRLEHNSIGKALVTAARTRPKLIGGARAVYNDAL